MEEWCRLCGTEDHDLIPVVYPLLDQIVHIFGIQIKPDDGFSQKACRKCAGIVKSTADLIRDYKAKQIYLIQRFQRATKPVSQQSSPLAKKSNVLYNCSICEESFSQILDLQRHSQKRHSKLTEICDRLTNPCHVILQKLPFAIPKKRSDLLISSDWVHIDEENIRKIDFKIPHCFLSKQHSTDFCKKSFDSEVQTNSKINFLNLSTINDIAASAAETLKNSQIDDRVSFNAESFRNEGIRTSIPDLNLLLSQTASSHTAPISNLNPINCKPAETSEFRIAPPLHRKIASKPELRPSIPNQTQNSEPETRKRKLSSDQELSAKNSKIDNISLSDSSFIKIEKSDVSSIIDNFFKQKMGFSFNNTGTNNIFSKALCLGHVDVDWSPFLNRGKKGVFAQTTDKITVISEIDTMEGFQKLEKQTQTSKKQPINIIHSVTTDPSKKNKSLEDEIDLTETELTPKIVSTFTVSNAEIPSKISKNIKPVVCANAGKVVNSQVPIVPSNNKPGICLNAGKNEALDKSTNQTPTLPSKINKPGICLNAGKNETLDKSTNQTPTLPSKINKPGICLNTKNNLTPVKSNQAPKVSLKNKEKKIGLIIDKNQKASLGLIKCKPTKLLMYNGTSDPPPNQNPQTVPYIINNSYNHGLATEPMPATLPTAPPSGNIPYTVHWMNSDVNIPVNNPPLPVRNNSEIQNNQTLPGNSNGCEKPNDVFLQLQQYMSKENITFRYIDHPCIRGQLIQILNFTMKDFDNMHITNYSVYLFIDQRKTLVLSITDDTNTLQNFHMWSSRRQKYVINAMCNMPVAFEEFIKTTPYFKPFLLKFMKTLWKFDRNS